MRVCAALALLGLAFALASVGLMALQVRMTVSMLPSILHREAEATRTILAEQVGAIAGATNWQINQARLTADRQIGDTREALVSEVRVTRREALAAIDALSQRAEQQIGDVRADLSGQLTTANETLARETARLNSSVAVLAEVAPPLTATAKRFQEVVEIGTDCEASPRCWQNTLYDMNAASQKSSSAFAEFTVQTAGIASDVHRFTTEFTRPRTLREKLWSAVKAGSGIAVLAWR